MIGHAIRLSLLFFTALAAVHAGEWERHIETGDAAMARGDYHGAKRHFHLAANIIRTAPPEDPRHTPTGTRLGFTYGALGDFAQSERWLSRALELAAQSGYGENAELTLLVSDFANLYRLQGKTEKAEALYRRALERLSRDPKPPDYVVAQVLSNLGTNQIEQGDFAAAAQSLLRAAAIARSLPPDRAGVEAEILYSLGSLYRRQGKRQQALSTLSQACESVENRFGPSHPDLFVPLFGIAGLHEESGDYAAALAASVTAVRLGETGFGPDHPAIVDALEQQARLLRKLNRKGEAGPLEVRAKSLRRSAGNNDLGRHTVNVRDLGRISPTPR